MRQFKLLGAVLVAALLAAGCGGGGGDGDQSPRIAISSVKVMGDSLSDSGTFLGLPTYGRIFGVQGSTSKNYAELTAASYGITSLCNFYKFTGATFIPNPTAGCTYFGVGGGRINPSATTPGGGGTATPFSIIKQLTDAGTGTTYQASDLLVIDGGGNDAADLVGAYLKASTDSGVAFMTVLGSLTGVTMPTGAAGFPAAGVSYMTLLANSLFDAIKTNALDKGATHVAVINAPAITNTPRFQMVLDQIATAYGGGTAGATARAQSEALFKSWVEAFNAQLAVRAAVESRVVVVDLYNNFNDYIAHSSDYGLTNVTTPACPMVMSGDAPVLDSLGLPTYNFETCTDTALSAMTPPVGATGGANWWKTYAFSDGFHPTPAVYLLASQLLNRSLIQAGWL